MNETMYAGFYDSYEFRSNILFVSTSKPKQNSNNINKYRFLCGMYWHRMSNFVR